MLRLFFLAGEKARYVAHGILFACRAKRPSTVASTGGVIRIVGILLCAGSGTRFGGDKLLARLPDGRSLGEAACAALRPAVSELVAVLRAHDVRLTQILRDAGARVVECIQAERGMGASLACGVRSAREADGWLIALGDMPWIRASTGIAVAAALAEGSAVVVPHYRGAAGHPVGFARAYYPALAGLDGDRGARDVVRAAGNAVRRLECDDAGILRDVDERQDIA